MKSFAAFTTTLFCLLCILSPAEPQPVQESEEVRLTKHFRRNYPKTAPRPVKNDSTTVNVTLDMAFNQLLEIDQRQQVMIASVFLRLFWVDEYLRWDEEEFKLNSILLPPDTIWIPDITLDNHAHDEVSSLPVDTLLRVNSSGHVRWLQPTVTRSQCTLNTLYFPFDVQICQLGYRSWVYHEGQVDFYPIRPTGDVTKYLPNGVWELNSLPARRLVQDSPCCPVKQYPVIIYYVVLWRLPVYYVINLYYPCVIITFLSLLVFYLPNASGEKTSFAVTMLLSLMVFMLVAIEYLPDSSDAVPIMTQYFTGAITLLGLNVFVTVLTLQVYHRGDFGAPPPPWLKRLAFKYLARFVCLSMFNQRNLKEDIKQRALGARQLSLAFAEVRNQLQLFFLSSNDTISSQDRGDEGENQSQANDVGRQASETEAQLGLEYALLSTLMKDQVRNVNSRGAIQEEWSKIAAVLDRVSLLVFFLATLALNAYPFARYYLERDTDNAIEHTEAFHSNEMP